MAAHMLRFRVVAAALFTDIRQSFLPLAAEDRLPKCTPFVVAFVVFHVCLVALGLGVLFIFVEMHEFFQSKVFALRFSFMQNLKRSANSIVIGLPWKTQVNVLFIFLVGIDF